MRRSTSRLLLAALLVLVAVTLSGCSLGKVTLSLQFSPDPVVLRQGEPFNVDITLVANGMGGFFLKEIIVEFHDEDGEIMEFPPEAQFSNPQVVTLNKTIFVPGLFGAKVGPFPLGTYVSSDKRILPDELFSPEAPHPVSVSITFVDTKGGLRGGGELGLEWEIPEV